MIFGPRRQRPDQIDYFSIRGFYLCRGRGFLCVADDRKMTKKRQKSTRISVFSFAKQFYKSVGTRLQYFLSLRSVSKNETENIHVPY